MGRKEWGEKTGVEKFLSATPVIRTVIIKGKASLRNRNQDNEAEIRSLPWTEMPTFSKNKRLVFIEREHIASLNSARDKRMEEKRERERRKGTHTRYENIVVTLVDRSVGGPLRTGMSFVSSPIV